MIVAALLAKVNCRKEGGGGGAAKGEPPKGGGGGGVGPVKCCSSQSGSCPTLKNQSTGSVMPKNSWGIF